MQLQNSNINIYAHAYIKKENLKKEENKKSPECLEENKKKARMPKTCHFSIFSSFCKS